MKRKTMFAMALALVLAAGAIPALAQRGRGGGPPGRPSGGPPGADRSRDNSNDRSSRDNPGASQKKPGELLTQNTKLANKLHSLLPANTNLQTAASGFKNLGQFVAAVHVAHNLGIPFNDLKAKLTGPNAESLGKAIHDLKPDADAKAEAKKAKYEADEDMKES